MKIIEKKPPREFKVGWENKVTLKDCAEVQLAPDEQITLSTESGNEYDICRKSWGFYATPSLNGRLTRFKLHGTLVKNRVGQCFVLLVADDKRAEFEDYIKSEQLEIIRWLDNDHDLSEL